MIEFFKIIFTMDYSHQVNFKKRKVRKRDYDGFNFSDSATLLFATALLTPFGESMKMYLLGMPADLDISNFIYIVSGFILGLIVILLGLLQWESKMTQADIQFLISAVLFVAGAFAVCLFEPFLDYLENKKNRENA
jgi:hypothetical protein